MRLLHLLTVIVPRTTTKLTRTARGMDFHINVSTVDQTKIISLSCLDNMRCNVIDDVFNCAVLGHSRRTYAINPLKEASYLPFDFTASPFMKSKLQRDALKSFLLGSMSTNSRAVVTIMTPTSLSRLELNRSLDFQTTVVRQPSDAEPQPFYSTWRSSLLSCFISLPFF